MTEADGNSSGETIEEVLTDIERRLKEGEADRARLDFLERGGGGVSVWGDNSPATRWNANGFDHERWGTGPTIRDAIDDMMRRN